jgi:hypothetical protein
VPYLLTQARSYELLTRNCHTFCSEVARELGVKEVPGWITRFATIGNSTRNTVQSARVNVKAFDDRYDISKVRCVRPVQGTFRKHSGNI